MEKNSQKRVDYVSVLNVLSCFSVVVLHCNGVFWSRPDGRLWITSNFLETFFYFGVPIFFMISGVTLMDYNKRYSTRVYFEKRLHKVVIPFFIWSIISFLYSSRMAMQSGEKVDINIIHIIDNILNCRYMSIYWFFPPLFAVYLSIPVLAQIQNKERVYKYIAVTSIIFILTPPMIASLLSIGYNVGFIPCIMSGYILYPIVGYLFHKREFSTTERRFIYLAGVIGWAAQFIGTFVLSGPGEINDTFKGYLNLPAFLQACAVFVALKYHTPNERVMNGINWLAKRTFGIYLLHMYLIQDVSQTLKIDMGSILWRTIGAAIIFVLSAGIVWVMQQIPILKRIVP